jgi:hypothetical protein
VPDIVMRPLLRHAGDHRQYQRGPLQGLDLLGRGRDAVQSSGCRFSRPRPPNPGVRVVPAELRKGTGAWTGCPCRATRSGTEPDFMIARMVKPGGRDSLQRSGSAGSVRGRFRAAG